MRRNGKIIKMNPAYFEGGSCLFLIYRKNNPCHNPDNENDNSKDHEIMRTAPMWAKRD